jgi:hypothetical protein
LDRFQAGLGFGFWIRVWVLGFGGFGFGVLDRGGDHGVAAAVDLLLLYYFEA